MDFSETQMKKDNNEQVYKIINESNDLMMKENNQNVLRSNTCLMVIDMLNVFVKKNGALYHENYKNIIPNINEIIKIARDNNLPVIFIRHCYKDPKPTDKLFRLFPSDDLLENSKGTEIYKKLNFDQKKDYFVKKRRYSGFSGTDLDLILRENNIKNIIVTGCKTNNCVRATVDHAYHLNYNIIIPENCVATDGELVHTVNLKDMIDFFSVNYISNENLNKLLLNNQ